MAKKSNTIQIPQKDDFEKWLPENDVKNSSIKSYLTYVRNCIKALKIDDQEESNGQNDLGLDLLGIFNSFIKDVDNELDSFITNINLAVQLLSDKVGSKQLSGLFKYVDFLIAQSGVNIKIGRKTKKLNSLIIIPVEEYRKKIEERYNSDERYNSKGVWWPTRILSPILNSNPNTRNEFKRLKDSVKDHFLIITEKGIVRLTAVSYFVAIITQNGYELYVRIKDIGHVLKVYYQVSQGTGSIPRLERFKNINGVKIKKYILEDMSREHFIPMDWTLSMSGLNALTQVKNVLINYGVTAFKVFNKHKNKNRIINDINNIGVRYILSDMIYVESLMTHTLMPERQNIISGAHNKSSASKNNKTNKTIILLK